MGAEGAVHDYLGNVLIWTVRWFVPQRQRGNSKTTAIMKKIPYPAQILRVAVLQCVARDKFIEVLP